MKVELKYPFGTWFLDLDLEEEVNTWLNSMVEDDETEEERKEHLKKLEYSYLYCVLTPSDLLDINEFMEYLHNKYEDYCKENTRWKLVIYGVLCLVQTK